MKNNGTRKMESQVLKQKATIKEPIYISSRSQTPDIYPPPTSKNATSAHVIDFDFEDDLNELVDLPSDSKGIASASVARRRTLMRKRSGSSVKASRSKKIAPGRIQVVSDSGSSSSSEDDFPDILDGQGTSNETTYIPPRRPSISTVELEQNIEKIPAEDVPGAGEPALTLEAEDAKPSVNNNVKAQIDISSLKSGKFRANTFSQSPSPSTSSTIRRLPSITVRSSASTGDKTQETMRQPSPESTLTAISSYYSTPEINDAQSEIESASGRIVEEDKSDEMVKKVRGKDEVLLRKQVDDESEEELDDVCHGCRNRNVYAKMRCANPKGDELCGLYFCHRCMAVK